MKIDFQSDWASKRQNDRKINSRSVYCLRRSTDITGMEDKLDHEEETEKPTEKTKVCSFSEIHLEITREK